MNTFSVFSEIRCRRACYLQAAFRLLLRRVCIPLWDRHPPGRRV